MKNYVLLALLLVYITHCQAHLYVSGYPGGYAGGYAGGYGDGYAAGYAGYLGPGPFLGPSVPYGTPFTMGGGVLPYGQLPFTGAVPFQGPPHPYELVPIGAVAMMGYSMPPYPYGFAPDYY